MGAIPALMSSRDLSFWGTSEKLGRRRWPFVSKYAGTSPAARSGRDRDGSCFSSPLYHKFICSAFHWAAPETTNAPRALRTHRGEALLHGTTLIRRRNRPLSRPVTGTKRAARRGRLGSGSTLRRSRRALTLPRLAWRRPLRFFFVIAFLRMLLLYHELRGCQQMICRNFTICGIFPLPFPRRLVYWKAGEFVRKAAFS